MEKDTLGIEELRCMCSLYYMMYLCLQRRSAQYDSVLIKLANAETQIEDLKLQLDDALGAEEMLVQLTERNLMLGEVRRLLPCLIKRSHLKYTDFMIENRGDADND
jgi:hypothetical protein